MTKKKTSPPPKTTSRGGKRKIESSTFVDTRPRQPKLRKTPGAKRRIGTPASVQGPDIIAAAKKTQESEREELIAAARATGLLPHEWMLAVMRGEYINHFAYDSDTQEIIEITVLPTFSDRMEMAKAAAPYFQSKAPPTKPGDAGGAADPAKARGVIEVPIADSLQQWTDLAAASQAKLKREVVK